MCFVYLVFRFYKSNHESHEKEHETGKVAKFCANFVASWFQSACARDLNHELARNHSNMLTVKAYKHTDEAEHTENTAEPDSIEIQPNCQAN